MTNSPEVIIVRALAHVADVHHRTIEGSKKHDPEKHMNFWDCPCLTCMNATKAIREFGWEPSDIILPENYGT